MTLPDGFQVTLARDVITLAGGAVLVGGSPLVSLRLSPRASALLRDGTVTVDGPVAATLAERLLATNVAHPHLAAEPPIDPEDLTVVIPVRDRYEELGRALAALDGLGCVVVDDDSADGAAIAALAHRFNARYIRMDSNVGPAAARNAGLSAVSTRYVAFVDSDVEVGIAELSALCRHFADPSVALVAPMVVGTAGVRRSWFTDYDEIASSLTLGEKPASVRPGATVAWVPSACLVGRTSALGDGFDADLRVGEDVDLVWRLVASGRRVRYDPSVTARHRIRPTTRTWLARKVFYGTGTAQLATRYGDATAPAALSPTYAFTAAALLAAEPLAIPLVLWALLVGTRNVGRTMTIDGRCPHRHSQATAVAAQLSTRGLWWALRQEAALVLRHWWPATLVGALVSARARRAILTALAVDTIAFITTTPKARTAALPRLLLARRLDDLAYGAGLWWGSLRLRSILALRPRGTARNRRPTRSATPGTSSAGRPDTAARGSFRQ